VSTHSEMARQSGPVWLVTNKMVYPPTDGHPSKYLAGPDIE